MKAKRRILTSVLVLVLLVALLAGTAVAAAGSKTLQATFRDIAIQFNGKAFTPKDANGKTVEPFIVDGTTYLPVRAVTEQMGYDVEWDAKTNTVSIGQSLPAQVKANRETIIAFLAETSNTAYAKYFADNAEFQCSLGGKSVIEYDLYRLPVQEWLAGLSKSFVYKNDYAEFGIQPVFTPVNEAYNNIIMAKASTTENGKTTYWTMDFTFDANGKITTIRAAADVNEEAYLQNMRAGKFDYETKLDATPLRTINLHTLDLWFDCRGQYRNTMRKPLVTDDATTSVFVGIALEQTMWVADEKGYYVEGWLDPNGSEEWGFWNLSKTGKPDKIFECVDMPNVFLVDAIGYSSNTSFPEFENIPYQPNYFLHITMRDDGKICNFREQSQGLDRYTSGYVDVNGFVYK